MIPMQYDGGCTCRTVRYRMNGSPMFVHCCHCRWCQRETGSAFAVNAMIEADRVILVSGRAEIIDTPSQSGKGQRISRCPECRVAVWSNYAGAGAAIRFLRVGTLDEPAACRRARRRSPSTTRRATIGRHRAWSGVQSCAIERRRRDRPTGSIFTRQICRNPLR
jgi:hypothetical protein